MKIKSRYLATCILLMLALGPGLIPRAGARSGDLDEEKPIRLYSSAYTWPIGQIVGSSLGHSGAFINGRAIAGDQALWGGEVVQAPSSAGIRVSFDSIGQVTLGRGSAVRFATAPSEGESAGSRVLIASVIEGDITVKLHQEAGAYVRAGGNVYTAVGASFRVGIRTGQPVLDTMTGTVAMQQPAQRQYILRPVGLGSTISVRARATRQIQIQVTDENDQPQPNVPVVFALSGGTGANPIGTLGAAGLTTTLTTNAQGIVTVDYTAGPTATAGAITATVEGTNFSWTGQIQVLKAVGFWTARNTVIAAGVAAAAAGVGVAVANRNNGNNDELRPLPPPVVNP